ncbi:hypothetical protein [Paenibacillus polymyxa]|uniref:Uncharacterized protein n=1 Tax=Paenibacillus polymyxa (strain SC2) TaxID=886882 RepID=E3ELF0_PAEPS|nr:hypothetical protein [Paenibacillus polymyxa]ADO59982.1 hypothetical protein PPSC2_28275 [Paenibacillus polymyxa SC2]WPQ59801.1 hypothetical protein SKN87_26290 [Paenibacillus polymyxa]
MIITMTRYKRCELEAAVKEKEAQGWVCIGEGIVEIGTEKKIWSFEDRGRSKYYGRTGQNKFVVKMKAPEERKRPA